MTIGINETEDVRKTITLVTGANKGIGYETARQLIDRGHTVYIGARDPERGKKAAAEIGCRFVHLDVTDDDVVAVALATIDADEGRLDVLINNAGIGGSHRPTDELTGADASLVFETNAVGVVRVTHAALPLLRKSSNPVVVNVSSALGSFWAVHNPEHPASLHAAVLYGSSKAAVSMITAQYAKGVPEVKFNAVEPGYTATDLTNGNGRPVEESGKMVARMATIDADGPTGTFQQDCGVLPW
ncbi:MAG: SDR family NAD(P)-dependent oxidoreductase [Acidimicrobiales bacterium]|jgi:NAD(P)-dependent dehydrogenase (short-subunit alcohol dehydrogenase family)